jgi:transposase
MEKEQILQLVADLYIEGHSATEIAKFLQKKCENPPHVATIYRWIKKHKDQWDLRRKQKKILKVEKANEEQRALEEKIQIEIDKADALDYRDLCDLQRKYKEIAMKRYKPRAVEVVIQCIKLKREIREGLKPESENKIIIEFEGAPRKSNEVIYED